MNIAILTFQDAENYGAALQAYALRRAFGRYCNADIINYYNEYFHREINSGIRGAAIRALNYRTKKNKNERFLKFRNDYLTDGRAFVKKSELGMLNNQYDIFVTGSDQVWNLECSGEDWSYFLDFAEDEKRNSYAASFGSSTAGIANKEQMKQLLRNYSHISVREESGCSIISELLGKRVPVVLDPVFLLDKEEWKELFDLSFEEKYVLVYEVLAGDKLFDQAKIYAKSKGLKVICITSTNRVRQGAKVVKSAGPIEWLRLFAGASYVFTNSFHGLAFSLIFEKQFFVELLPPPANTNARILELLDKVGLTGRDSSKSMEMEEIDYTAVNNVLRTEKDLSLNYLKSIVEGGEN